MNKTNITPVSKLQRDDKGSLTFFEKRVDAIVSLLTPKTNRNDQNHLHEALMLKFNELENTSHTPAETWVLAIQRVLVDAKLLSENDINHKLELLNRIIEEAEALPSALPEFVRYETGSSEDISRMEGHPVESGVTLRVLQKTDGFLLLELRRRRGSVDPLHMHSDHETSSVLISGALKITLGEETHHAKPGDSWLHKIGVLHQTEALEDSVQISFKVPPVKTW